jgi:hypothetical protein
MNDGGPLRTRSPARLLTLTFSFQVPQKRETLLRKPSCGWLS